MPRTNSNAGPAGSVKRALKSLLSAAGITISRRPPNLACTVDWLDEARREGMEINDYIEKDQRKPAAQELEALVDPLITPDSIVCELGPGTGVYTRRLNQKIRGGQLHVVDADPYAIEFLKGYLPPNPATRLYLNSGTALPFAADGWIDLAFCASMFTGGNLSYFYRYLQEFARVLKPGGHCVFDYFDIATEPGWQVLTKNMARREPIFAYAYHAGATIDRVVTQLGFDIVGRQPTLRGSVFVTARKR